MLIRIAKVIGGLIAILVVVLILIIVVGMIRAIVAWVQR